MKTLATTLALLFAIAATSSVQAQFASIGSLASAASQDAMYDYELYVAEPETATGWYLLWTWEDGTTDVSSAFASEQAAKNFQDWLTWRGLDPSGQWYDPNNGYTHEIFQASKEPNWELFSTYGTRAQAEEEAEWFEDFGMLTKIRRVSVLQSRFLPARRW